MIVSLIIMIVIMVVFGIFTYKEYKKCNSLLEKILYEKSKEGKTDSTGGIGTGGTIGGVTEQFDFIEKGRFVEATTTDKNGDYEMISGHRRLHAAGIVGLSKIPAIVKEMSDDEAIIKMVDANIQREEIMPSEKAFAYKMKLEAMKRTAGRPTKENACHNGTHLRSDQELALQVGDSARSIQRYVRLTELVPELLDYVDNKKIGLVMAVDLSYLDEQVQKWVYEYFKENGFLKPVQVEALKNYPNLSNVTQFSVISIMNDALPKKSKESKLSFSAKKLDKYFPPQYSTKERENIIIQLLEQWSADQVQSE